MEKEKEKEKEKEEGKEKMKEIKSGLQKEGVGGKGKKKKISQK